MLKRMLLLVLGISMLVLSPTAGSASAGEPECSPPEQASYNNGVITCIIPGQPGEPGTPSDDDGGSGGGPVEPTCELRSDYTYCMGLNPCKNVEWVVPMSLPEGPKPQKDSEPRARECGLAPGVEGPVGLTYYWSDEGEPEPPSLADQALEAIGNLDLVMPDLKTSPAGRTVVNFPTWYWVEGGEPRVTSSSAFGLAAIATASEIQVDPGDGSGSFTCPWTTSAEEAEQSCSYTYPRASYNGSSTYEGRPAHEASVQAAYTLRFEVNGTPVANIPGAPTTLDGPSSTAVVRVDEVQSLVSRTD